MGVSFVFGAISSAIAMKGQSEAAKARLDGDLNRTKELYAQIAWKKTHGMGTDEELLWELKQATQGLRDTLNNTQYVGYGKEVSSALSQLDWIDSQIWMAEQELGGNIIYTEPGSATGGLTLPFGAASDAERQQAVSQILDKVFSGRWAEKTADVSVESKVVEGQTSEEGKSLTEEPLRSDAKSDIMRTGARDPQSVEADAHAERYYGLVRSMTTDVAKIAEVTGFDKADVQKVKEYLFIDRHDLGGEEDECFFPHYMIAESWQRLIAGTPEPHDITLLNHELLERSLVEQGMTQEEAHREASKKYNYDKESDEFYGDTKKH